MAVVVDSGKSNPPSAAASTAKANRWLGLFR